MKAKIKKVAETPTIEIFEREMTPLKSFVYLIPPNKFKIPHKPFIPAPSEGLSKKKKFCESKIKKVAETQKN